MTEESEAPVRSVLVVANPAAGTTSERLTADVLALCAAHAAHVRLHPTAGRGDATSAVRAARAGTGGHPRPDLVVAVGGDGTVHEVVDGLIGAVGTDSGARPALVIVPAGTGNSGYKMLWADRPWQTALRAVFDGPGHGARLHRLDLAHLAETGAKVFLGACSGVIADALRVARHVPQTGRDRYTTAFAEAADAFAPYPGRVTVDGTVLHEGPTVLANVGGGRFRGGRYQVLPHSEPDDGLLDVCVIGSPVDPHEVPELTRRAAHLGLPGVHYGRGRRIVVERLDGVPLCFEYDGNLQPPELGCLTFDVLPGALPVWGAETAVLATTAVEERR
ncbi:diacylglycerol/lipid kinase family protein [Streptomyces viridochromogenes]|uniref:diacylglycerol/lipid kinase family protein n=1 Tax=Streptomyces viridochromogenes TaxID=1938 RepID=UPI00069D253F|nr:diacylglycerol kinase family protein [Streptomyces viridochromogenes]KOG16326.1 diacylglycerol kinase [Streptomyces viridochromogenes]KOG16862.1 diacylglycerol kinase [Streptomyces viridochromogenes]